MNILIKNIAQLVTPVGNTARRGADMQKLKIIENAGIFITDETIAFVGDSKEACAYARIVGAYDTIDAAGKCVLPGFVDSHTHFIFGGYRPDEFVARVEGKPYLEIMKHGGGILSTVRATRAASEEQLYRDGMKRVRRMLAQGVTTLEGKSGYGLDLACELRQLNVMKKISETQPVDIVRTYLGAHAVPEEYKGKTGAYIDFMVSSVMPRVKEDDLAEFCDVFCEDSVFSVEESERILAEGQKLGLASKIHADEIVPLGGGELAARLGAVSADHLLMVSDQGIADMAKAGVVATLLPCTAFCLNKPYAPARKFIDGGCAVAVASDYNPGSCFAGSIPLMLGLCVIHMGMTIEETITAVTLNGAAAVKRADTVGSVEPGKKADLVILEYPSYKFLVYNTGANIVDKVIKSGVVVYENTIDIS